MRLLIPFALLLAPILSAVVKEARDPMIDFAASEIEAAVQPSGQGTGSSSGWRLGPEWTPMATPSASRPIPEKLKIRHRFGTTERDYI